MSDGAGMRAATDTVVTIEYRASLTNGDLVDSTDHCGPVTYLHGNEQIFPALEQAVDGLMAGEERRLSLSAQESYGEHRPELIRRMPRAQLPPELALEVGKRYTIRPPRGEPMKFRLVGRRRGRGAGGLQQSRRGAGPGDLGQGRRGPARDGRRDPTGDVAMKLSIVMPVYNESASIREILKRVQALPHAKEIIVVDDGSLDGTRDILRELAGGEIRVFFHGSNRGKGAALRTGFAHVRGDVVVVQDADLEYNPRDIPSLLASIESGEADVVFGSRFLGGPHRVLNFWHYVGNRVLTLLSNMFTNLNLTDMETGYKLFRREVLQQIEIECDRFGFEPEITAKVARLHCRIYEQPISYAGRDYDQGKKITWRDGVAALYHIARFSIRDRRVRPAPPLAVEEIAPRPAQVADVRRLDVER